MRIRVNAKQKSHGTAAPPSHRAGTSLHEAALRLPTALAAVSCLALWLAGSAAASAQSAGTSPPEAQTEPAEVTPNGVRLEGKLNPGGLPTSYHFEYSSATCDESSSCVKQTAIAGPLDGDTQQEVPAVEVTGLLTNHRYAYRLAASNADGTEYGAFVTFTTAATGEPPSEVQTEPAEVTANGVRLEGKLDPGGLPTSYHFEYSSATCDESSSCVKQTAIAGPLDGDTQQEVPAVEVTGLIANHRYAYRLAASNADGTEYGAFVTFTTAATGEPPSEVHPEPVAAPMPLLGPLPTPLSAKTSPIETIEPNSSASGQMLAKALKKCRHKAKRQRAICHRQAHQKYGLAARKKSGRAGSGKSL